MDVDFNAIPLGVEYGQLTADEKRLLFECMSRLLPLGWSEDLMHVWYMNRKLSVVRSGSTTRYYGLVSTTTWRLLLETTTTLVDGKPKVALSWKVGTFQWLPLDLAEAHQEALKGLQRR